MKKRAYLLLLAALPAWADTQEIKLQLREHRFEPAEIRLPAGKKVKLLVRNLDSTTEEFESHELNREKVIAPGAEVGIFIGPLSPGRYPFFGEFHEKTARGVVIVE